MFTPSTRSHARNRSLSPTRLLGATSLALLLLPSAGIASDGVLEINQTCATLTGCFSGDTAGFPVTIDGSAGGSYLLTSDLAVPDANTDGILVTTSHVTLDLGGFSLHGPTVCSGTPVSCAPTGSGSGIRAGLVSNGTTRSVAVHGGIVHGFGSNGLLLRESARVDDVHVASNGSSGIVVGDDSIVTRCIAESNGSDGIKAGGDATVVTQCTAALNGSRGIYAGPGSTVTQSTARSNGGGGIEAGDGTGGTKGNVITDNVSRENGRNGIYFWSGGVARGNVVTLNADDGIHASDGVLIVDNDVVDNGNGPTDDGIECAAGCSVRGNAVRANDGLGLNLGATSAYSGNTITLNAAGTVAGGIGRSENYCDGAAAPNCP